MRYSASFPAPGVRSPRRREVWLRSPAWRHRSPQVELSIQIRRVVRSATPAASARQPHRQPSTPDRRTRAWHAPSIRGRVLDRLGPPPRFPPSAWRRGVSALRHMVRALPARSQTHAHRALHALPPTRPRAVREPSRRVFACASAARARCRRAGRWHSFRRCRDAD